MLRKACFNKDVGCKPMAVYGAFSSRYIWTQLSLTISRQHAYADGRTAGLGFYKGNADYAPMIAQHTYTVYSGEWTFEKAGG